MDNTINNLNTYIELIKYTKNKITKNDSDYITESVISYINKNINDIKNYYSNSFESNNQILEDTQNTIQKEDTQNTIQKEDTQKTIQKEDTQNTIQNQDTQNSIQKEDTILYYKVHPKQISRLEKFNKSIYLY